MIHINFKKASCFEIYSKPNHYECIFQFLKYNKNKGGNVYFGVVNVRMYASLTFNVNVCGM